MEAAEKKRISRGLTFAVAAVFFAFLAFIYYFVLPSPASHEPRNIIVRIVFGLTMLMLIGAMTVGCNLRLPRWRFPGHLYRQQLDASYHDPYADLDSGPEVVGGRPLQYSEPRSLPVKSQWKF